MRFISNDQRGCNSEPTTRTTLFVNVTARPVKPAVPASTVSLCQYQTSDPLSASVTASEASLVWYGTDATGGTGSANASRPATTNAGTFKYYVAQRVNDCEGERAEITVEVKKAPNAPTVLPEVVNCQKADGSNNITSLISVTASSADAVTKLYDEAGRPAQYVDRSLSSFVVPKPGFPSTTIYRVTQVLNGCESRSSEVRLIIKPKANVYAEPINVYSSVNSLWGKIEYCVGSQAKPIVEYGVKPLPANITLSVIKLSGDIDLETSTNSPTPKTDKAGTATLGFMTYLDGCPASLNPHNQLVVTIKPRPDKATASVKSLSWCQGQKAEPLNASATSGASLVWYGTSATGGKGSTVASTPETANAGTLNYYVAQQLNDCESERTSIEVVIKPTPAAPDASPVTACQQETAPVLRATGQNLLWYNSQEGGTGSVAAPVVSTSQASQNSYYVSQSLDGCESRRAVLPVTVYATPDLPKVEPAGPYCQYTQALPVVATGQNLKWYRDASGGASMGSTVTPDTKEPGSFTYYVSQSINGCEGGRSSFTVKITPAPTLPSAITAYSYCQKDAATALKATGNALTWYDASGKRSDTAPTPSTDTPGTVSYFVTQTVENCESGRVDIKITTKPTPGAPGTSAVTVCQNANAQTVTASGQNLLWYTTNTGGTGAGMAPTINTNQSGQTTYYVSQTLDGCEGPRATLTATVKPLPPAPGVTQRDICQFAKPEPVTATGVDLKWYNPEGNRFNETPIINTEKGAAFSYQVSQTVDGCEGPRATLSVNVLTTPTPIVPKTTLELCQGTTAQPLDATGTNLKWTDPSGATSANAPVPSTSTPTSNADGNVYYVTQTGNNGCESPRVVIRVFVQTTPSLAVGGSATTNLGLEVPLKLTFAGVGPYRYRLSAEITGTATKDTTILVLPERTTTYQVVEVTNRCGVGQALGSATITVLIPTIQTLASVSNSVCVGTSVAIDYTTTGSFNPGSIFKLQLAKVDSDSNRANFMDMANAIALNGRITGIMPTTVATGTYWVRVMATNPKIPIYGTISPTRLTVRPIATATLTGTQSIYEGETAKLSVALTGDAPWIFSYRDSSATGTGEIRSVQTDVNPYQFDVMPLRTTAYYLTGVSNVCGNNAINKNLIVITVSPLLGVDDPTLAESLSVYPVPATSALTVAVRGLSATQSAYAELLDASGRAILRTDIRRETTTLPLDQQAAGAYLLRIRVGDKTATKRVLKL
ncbi:T9SS type A sorting domain-containing protein [Spirosoma montaniterrae]|uniref:Ig-like domain-containing protein n=1 Tax=Spirosoma montaniterrae TaxID=1178516 RepID=A0A1P9WV81_9BACT|nr:T9SS type A sorting domain-containing protein [Spirosoma montaniterrae]AQG79302.1 hypothetical protein AWR27_08185 [Spirosoma montaniterrae]